MGRRATVSRRRLGSSTPPEVQEFVAEEPGLSVANREDNLSVGRRTAIGVEENAGLAVRPKAVDVDVVTKRLTRARSVPW
jgi:hypothetical protein